jgi:hypothetical protein
MRERTTKKLAKFAIAYLGALLLVGTPATSSAAEEPTNTQEESSLSASDSPTDTKEERWPWRFIVNVYGWLPKAPVDIKIDGNDIENFPESFDNIFDSLQFASMSEVEVHKGPFGVFASPIYYSGDDDEKFTGLAGERRKATLDEDVWLIKYGASYDLGPWHLGETSDSPAVVLQPYVGGLYFHDDIEMKVSPGLFDIGLDYKTTLTFNTPIVGLNTLWDLTKRWTLRLGGNYGGFHQDNVKKTYEFVGTVGYRFKMWDVSSKVFAGYRYLHLDYDREVELQVDIKGPLFGIGWEF